MVLGELVLRPIPVVVAHRVAKYAEALGVKDDFVRVARRYAQGAYGLAWMDLQRNGFVEHVRDADEGEHRRGRAARAPHPFEPARRRPRARGAVGRVRRPPRRTRSAARSGRCTTAAASRCPGTPGGAPAYLAQHDFVHVLADYGTNLKGELEVFAFIGRADPDPKGFAWLATLIGLFETGYIPSTGFFDRDVRERDDPGAGHAPADRRRASGAARWCATHYGVDLFDVDYHELARPPGRGGPRAARRAAEVGRARSTAVRPGRSTSKACPRPSGESSRNVGESAT